MWFSIWWLRLRVRALSASARITRSIATTMRLIANYQHNRAAELRADLHAVERWPAL